MNTFINLQEVGLRQKQAGYELGRGNICMPESLLITKLSIMNASAGEDFNIGVCSMHLLQEEKLPDGNIKAAIAVELSNSQEEAAKYFAVVREVVLKEMFFRVSKDGISPSKVRTFIEYQHFDDVREILKNADFLKTATFGNLYFDNKEFL